MANRKVESLQMTLAALKDDHERLKGSEASLRTARANLKDREEKLRAMSKQLEAARCAPKQALHHLFAASFEPKSITRESKNEHSGYQGFFWVCRSSAMFCFHADTVIHPCDLGSL